MNQIDNQKKQNKLNRVSWLLVRGLKHDGVVQQSECIFFMIILPKLTYVWNDGCAHPPLFLVCLSHSFELIQCQNECKHYIYRNIWYAFHKKKHVTTNESKGMQLILCCYFDL